MGMILFRGKRKDNGEWIRGNYIYAPSNTFVHNICESNAPYDWYEVDPETVGQFIGLTDKNGKKIFEDDIVRLYCGIYGTYEMHILDIRNGFRPIEEEKIKEIEIIGNIHDNPELFERRNEHG